MTSGIYIFAKGNVGKPYAAFTADCLERGYTCRIAMKDGGHCILTQDFNPQRINVELVNNIVVRITGIG